MLFKLCCSRIRVRVLYAIQLMFSWLQNDDQQGAEICTEWLSGCKLSVVFSFSNLYKRMEDILPKFKQLQKRLEVYHSNEHVRLDIELYKKLLAISQPGQYYYFTFDPKRVEFIYVSPEI